jgi:hypothetical protein
MGLQKPLTRRSHTSNQSSQSKLTLLTPFVTDHLSQGQDCKPTTQQRDDHYAAYHHDCGGGFSDFELGANLNGLRNNANTKWHGSLS